MPKNQRLRDKILGARDAAKKPVSVPEWGLDEGLFLRSMSIRDALAFEKANEGVLPETTTSLYLAFTICDADGQPVFDPSDQADLDELLNLEPNVVGRLFDEALKVNNGDPKVKDAEGKPLPNPL
jgi:hypothetical protein